MSDTIWLPEDGDDADGPIQVSAMPAFGKAVVIDITRSEVRRLIQRMKQDRRENLVAVSNKTFRSCAEYDISVIEGEEWEKFCGNVVVFHCARYVLDDRGIPLRVNET